MEQAIHTFTVVHGQCRRSMIAVRIEMEDAIAPEIVGPSGNAGDATSTISLDEGVTMVANLTANDTSNVMWDLNGERMLVTLLFLQMANCDSSKRWVCEANR